jgi:hypothetical protein
MRVFGRMLEGLAAQTRGAGTVMIDARYLKTQRAASSLRVKNRILGA